MSIRSSTLPQFASEVKDQVVSFEIWFELEALLKHKGLVDFEIKRDIEKMQCPTSSLEGYVALANLLFVWRKCRESLVTDKSLSAKDKAVKYWNEILHIELNWKIHRADSISMGLVSCYCFLLPQCGAIF